MEPGPARGAERVREPGFARVQERAREGEARLLVTGHVAYPLVPRPLPFAMSLRGSHDAASPPFTGPIGNGGALEAAAVADALRRAGAVAESAHLHPWSSTPDAVGGGDPEREIVWVDLALDEERLWRESYSSACRKNVNRAERECVAVRTAASAEDIAEFHRMYIGTISATRRHGPTTSTAITSRRSLRRCRSPLALRSPSTVGRWWGRSFTSTMVTMSIRTSEEPTTPTSKVAQRLLLCMRR